MNHYASEFIEKVLTKVKYRKVHPMLAKELYDHIECLKEEYCDKGMDEESAYKEAITQMGDPEKIGIELYHQHKPKMDWMVLSSILVLTMFGIYVLYSSGRTESILHMLIYTGIGLAGFIVCYFMNYQHLKKYTLVFLIAGIVLLLFTKKCGLTINGVTRNLNVGPLSIKMVVVAIPMFLVGTAGVLAQWKESGMKRKTLSLVLIVAGVLLTLDNYFMEGILLMITLYLTTIHFVQRYEKRQDLRRKKIKFLMGAGILIFLVYGFKISLEAYRIERLYAWLDAENNPKGYLFMKIRQLLSNVGLFGDSGLQAWDEATVSLFIDGEKNYAFLYIIGKLGIIGGIVTVGVLCSLVVRSFLISRQHRDCYGSMVMTVISIFFAMQAFVGIITHLGWMPAVAIYIPFLSYDGSSLIFEMACLGLFLGINRRKDILPNELIV